ncbi:MAG: RIP metalloprotease RseP [Candidatus Omnitrophica bacterium]|nr:RIP metalloprotease RseP [Candidatus Omnitrophota bacterium]
MLTLLIFILILSVLIIVHEFGHLLAAKRVGVRVEKFSLSFGPQLWKTTKDGTEYSVAAIPLGGFVKLAGDNLEEYSGKPYEYYSKTPGERFQIIFAGPLLNYVLGFLFFWVIFFAGYPTLTAKVGGLLEGMGAKEAGLQVGDKITAIDGKTVLYWDDMQSIIRSKKTEDSVKLSVLRKDKNFDVSVRIREKQVDDQMGAKRSVGLIGITPYDEIIKVRHGFLISGWLGLRQTWELTRLTYIGLGRMITGKLSLRDSVTGPLGIFYITSKAASVGLIAVMHLMAILSISLGIFNLLPLPVMDGGHIFLLGVEKLRRKGLSVKTENIITRIGVSLIITLAVLVTYNDIVRLFGDKIHKLIK